MACDIKPPADDSYAPFLDEESFERAEQAKDITSYETEINELQAEIERLESEIDALEAEKSKSVSKATEPPPSTAEDSSEDKTTASDSISVEATFYTAFCDTGCTGVTATGYDVSSTIYSPEGYRVIAVDPSLIPLDSVVEVTLGNGDSFKAKALDTGGDIKGARVDVLVADKAEARRLGRQSATVKIIKRGG